MNVWRLLLHAVIAGLLIEYCLSETTTRNVQREQRKLVRRESVQRHGRGKRRRKIRRHQQRKKMTKELKSALRNCNEIYSDTNKGKWTPEKCMTTLTKSYIKLCENKHWKRKPVRKCKLFKKRINELVPPGPQEIRLGNSRGSPRNYTTDKVYCQTHRGLRTYNISSHACCNGVKRRRTNDAICCQRKLVQSSLFLCCEDQIRKRTGVDIECCGTLAINISLLACCGEQPYDPTDTSLVCCGNETIMNVSTHFCHYRQPYPRVVYESKSYPNVDDKSDPSYTMIDGATVSTTEYFNTVTATDTEETDSNMVGAGLNDEVLPRDNNAHASGSHPSHGTIAGLVAAVVLTIIVIIIIAKWRLRRNPKDSQSVQNPGYDASPENNHRQLANSVPHPTISDGPTSIEVPVAHALNTAGESGESGYWSDMHVNNKINKPEDGTKLKNDTHAQQNLQTNKKRLSLKSVHSLEKRLEIDLSYLDVIKKATAIPEKNITKNLSKDSMTQTYAIHDPKTNVPDSFGNSFQFNELMSKNRKIVKLEDSDVTMVLPDKDLEDHTIECHASSFSNLPAIMHKLNVSASEVIASPMMEYFLPGIKMLQGYAIIEMPYIGKLEYLKVLRMLSDQGVNEIAKRIEVPRRDELDETLETFYIPDAHCKLVRIFTRVFSWYGCLTCKDGGHKISLKADLYGGIKKVESRVDLVLYILDDLHQFKDYYKEIKNQEVQQGRRYLEGDRNIDLPERICPSDQLLMYINLQDNMWRHMTDAQNPEFEANRQTVPFHQVMQCGHMTGTPYKCVWYLENIPGSNPDKIQCFLYIDIIPSEGAESSRSTIPTRVLVDERLKCCQDQDSIKAIVKLTGDQDEQTMSSLTMQLKGSLEVTDFGLENILHDLQTRLPRDAFVERVATAYNHCNLHKELECMMAIDIIPDSMKAMLLPQKMCLDSVRRELDNTPPNSYDKLCTSSNGGGRPHDIVDPEPEFASLPQGSYEKRNNTENITVPR